MSALTPTYRAANPQSMRKLTAAQIGATYTIAGSIFGEGIICVLIHSCVNGDVVISFDGVNDFIELSANTSMVIDLKSNKAALAGYFGIYLKDGTSAGAAGYVSIGVIGIE